MYHASIALGALDLSRKTLLAIPLERKDAAVGAITAYHTSISELKIEIVSNSVPQTSICGLLFSWGCSK